MARERDGAIEMLATTYLNMVATFIEKDNIIYLNNRLENVEEQDLKGDFDIFAQDQASTPISEQVKQNQLLMNIPTLVQLGVQPDKILEQVVRSLSLPEDFLEKAPPAAPQTAGVPPKNKPVELSSFPEVPATSLPVATSATSVHELPFHVSQFVTEGGPETLPEITRPDVEVPDPPAYLLPVLSSVISVQDEPSYSST